MRSSPPDVLPGAGGVRRGRLVRQVEHRTGQYPKTIRHPETFHLQVWRGAEPQVGIPLPSRARGEYGIRLPRIRSFYGCSPVADRAIVASSTDEEVAMTVINGVNVDELEGLRQLVAEDPGQARSAPRVTARWLGGDASRVECGSARVELGGEGNLNPMQALLASLAACEVDVIATHAALVGLYIEELELEAAGDFDLRCYLGFDDVPGSGFDEITYRVRLRAPAATPQQLAHLRERCEQSSPVGDTLARSVAVRMEGDLW